MLLRWANSAVPTGNWRSRLFLGGIFFGCMLHAITCLAQVQVGENLKMNLNGYVSAGYDGANGEITQSNHDVDFGGNASLTGAYYDPKFLSFNVSPFYHQSRLNSNSQSVSDATGVSATASIFSGSNFPGSISYMRAYNASGTFGLPGGINYTTDGNSANLAIGWMFRLRKLPTLSVNFQDGSNEYSVLNANTDGSSHYKSFSASSQYRFRGFSLNGGFHLGASESETPRLFGSNLRQQSDSQSSGFSFGVGHRLPWHGNFVSTFNRTSTDVEARNNNFSTAVDSASTSASINPTGALTLGVTGQYVNNVYGFLYQTILPASYVPAGIPSQSAQSLDLSSYAAYSIPWMNLTLNASEDHREATFLGRSFATDSILSGATCSRPVFRGYMSASTSFVYSIAGTAANQSNLGFAETINYSRQIRSFYLTGNFRYSQNTQTLLIGYTTSSISYSATLSRKVGEKSSLGLTASGSNTGLMQDETSASSSHGFAATFLTRWLGAAASYSESSGTSVLTSTGLTPVSPPITAFLPASFILYGGRAYSFSLDSSPIKNLVVSASYSNSYSNTQQIGMGSNNRTSSINSRLDYRFRKMTFVASFSRIAQSFSSVTAAQGTGNTYFIGVSRWFNFF